MAEMSAASITFPARGQSGRRAGQKFLFIHFAKPEEKFRLFVQTRAYAIKHGCNMLAHVRPVGAAA
jgi:hypothetical protein